MRILKQFIASIIFLLLGFVNFSFGQNTYQAEMKRIFLDNFPDAQEIVIAIEDEGPTRGFILQKEDLPVDKLMTSTNPELELTNVEIFVYDFSNKKIRIKNKSIRKYGTINNAVGAAMEIEFTKETKDVLYKFAMTCQEKNPGNRAHTTFSTTFWVQIGGTGTKRVARGIEGKLLVGRTDKRPLPNQLVQLKSGGREIASALTTNSGYFSLPQPFLLGRTYTLFIPTETLPKEETIYLADKNEEEVEEFEQVEYGFSYKLLPPIVTKLKLIENGDDPKKKVTLLDKFEAFVQSGNAQLEVVEEISYQSGAWTVPQEASSAINGMAETLKKHPQISLQIISHTDSRGDEQGNLRLSVKRAEAVEQQLLDAGVDSEQLSSEGLGESKILNRCKEGVDCSAEEHAKNRRTEFRFQRWN